MPLWLLSEAHELAGHLFSFEVSEESALMMKHTVEGCITFVCGLALDIVLHC
jgi:hypothetical protein